MSPSSTESDAEKSEVAPSLASRWAQKFGYALRGMAVAFRQEDSFAVHLPVGFAVLAYGALQGLERVEWLMLVLCVAIVIAAELFNSSIERLASTVTHEIDPAVQDALDISAGAVLAASIGAAVVGVIILF